MWFQRRANHVSATPPETPDKTLVERVEELEDAYHRLERRFTRLQGEFNATTRAVLEDPTEEEYDRE